MKMKNMLIGGMSLALVACISVGGTLAYLTATDKELTNTFKFGGITIDVTEISNSNNADNKETVGTGKVAGGINYTNLVAGQEINKQVDVKINNNVDAKLYVLVDFGEGNNALTLKENPTSSAYGWEAVEIVETNKKLYTRTVTADAEDKDFDLFDNVKVPDVNVEDGATVALNDIKITAYAVQADNIADGTSANQLAAEELGVTLKTEQG